ncbi:MAG TPA: NAD+ synthase [Thermoleophilaceae bacterium]|nr:NAD+ synthase [Thermoleophilaceae bacterium]
MSLRPEPLRCALAQINTTVGDIAGNADKIASATVQARERGAALVVFPELALTGYPPEDLLLKPHFLDEVAGTLHELATQTIDVVAIVGFPERADDVYNSAAVLADGKVAGVYRKLRLPNYGVFDEQRYFQTGDAPATIEVNGATIGLTICEDIWEPGPPATAEALAGAQVVVNLSASPYHHGKGPQRERMLGQRARDSLVSVLFCNAVGGQDELVFDGHSLALDHTGAIVARAPQFEESITVCSLDLGAGVGARLRDPRHRSDVRRARAGGEPPVRQLGSLRASARATVPGSDRLPAPRADLLDPEEEVYEALVMGVRDYVDKNGFGGVVLGLSGGIDSALAALVAVDALGPERVTTVVMPSPHSSDATQDDARTIAANLGTGLYDIPIGTAMEAYDELLADAFAGTEPDIAEENLQARIRGNLLMALSNKFGWLVLTTGNKSELSVGYSTLYGDMAGGFAVLKDVYKGWVYRLVRRRNEREGRELIPASVIDRAPSAELRADQRDEDSLPPYELLDAILEGYVEHDLDAAGLVARGHPADEVERVIKLVDGAEHKRRQAPPGVRISTRAFGRDRRLPITNGYGRKAPAVNPRAPAAQR